MLRTTVIVVVGLFVSSAMASTESSGELRFERTSRARPTLVLRNCPIVEGVDRVRILARGSRIALPRTVRRRPLRVRGFRFWACQLDESGRGTLFAKRRANDIPTEFELSLSDFIERKAPTPRAPNNENMGPDGREQTVRGTIERISRSGVTVNGVAFFFNSSSRFFTYDERRRVSYDYFRNGWCVEIESRVVGGRRIVEKMEVEDGCSGGSPGPRPDRPLPSPDNDNLPPAGRDVNVIGRIVRLSGDTIVVGGTSFTIASSTRFFDYDEAQRVQPSFFSPGMCVDVEGVSRGNGLEARKVELEDEC